jgi:RNA polymerase sigma-70 factor (ECF subfamily)
MTERETWRERAIRDAVLAGDAAAWRHWYDALYERLEDYARWRCGGVSDLTEDVVQETWLVAVKRLRSFDPMQGSFFDWLRGIAGNAARSAIRARSRLQKRSRQLVPGDDSPSVEVAGASDQRPRVAAALAALPDHYEEVLRAKYLDRLTVAEIAATRGETLKAVESLLSRARQAFRDTYEKTDE